MTTEDSADDRISRRRLLQTGAVGAGVAGAAWVAPTVLTMDAASAASCNCTTGSGINWSNTNIAGLIRPTTTQPTNISGYTPQFQWVPSTGTSFGGVQVQFSFAGNIASPYRLVFPYTSNLTGRQAGTQNGNVTGIYGLDKENTQAGDSVTLSIRFTCNVRNLAFTVLDIDWSVPVSGGTTARYTDQVTLAAFLGASSVNGTYTPVDASPSFTPTTPATNVASATFTGNATVGSTSTRGNVGVSVPGPLDRFDLTYVSAHAAGTTGTLQEVALSNLSWTC